jgi:hypothetical protein
MRCLPIFFGLILLAGAGFAVLGFYYDLPALGAVAGLLTLAGAVVFLWFTLGPAVRKRYGSQGERNFTLVISGIAIAVVALPLLAFLVGGAAAVEFNPTFLALVAWFVTLLAAVAGFILWSRYRVRRSWQLAAEQLGLGFQKKGPRVSGAYRGRHADLWLGSGSAGGVAHTYLALELRASPGLRVVAQRRIWTDRLLRRPGLQPSGDESLDRNYAFGGDVAAFHALVQAKPALRELLQRLTASRLRNLTLAPRTITYVRRNPLAGTGQVVSVFEIVGHIADLLENA